MPETSDRKEGGLHQLVEKIQSAASVKRVYGEPIAHGERTLIPVARVAFGFGGGLGAGRGEPAAGEGPGAEERSTGAGGGGAAYPVGVIEIGPEGTKFVPASPLRWILGGAAAGLLAGWLIGRRK